MIDNEPKDIRELLNMFVTDRNEKVKEIEQLCNQKKQIEEKLQVVEHRTSKINRK